MSLINDALKRATKVQAANPPSTGSESSMQPVESPRSVGLPVYFTPVLLFIVCGACWFLVKGWEANRPSGTDVSPITVQAREGASARPDEIPDPMPAAEPSVESLIPPNREFALNDAPAAAIAVSDATIASPPVAEPKVDFKLQGIFYRPVNPSALVNTKTVFVGDLISNGRVKAIDRQSVTIDHGGEIKVLTLQ